MMTSFLLMKGGHLLCTKHLSACFELLGIVSSLVFFQAFNELVNIDDLLFIQCN